MKGKICYLFSRVISPICLFHPLRSVLIKGIVMVVNVCTGRCRKCPAVHEDVKIKVSPFSSDRKRVIERDRN